MKMQTRSNVSVKTRVSFTKKVVIGVSFAVFVAFGIYIYLNFGSAEGVKAATTRKSKAEKKGDWETAASWNSNILPGSGDNYEIEGTIMRNGDLSIGNAQTLTIKAGDTLIITGDLILSNKSVLNIEDDAALIIRGDYTTHQQTNDNVQGGILIVLGKLTFSGGAADIFATPASKIYYDQTLNNPSYVNPKISGGGQILNITAIPNSLFEASYGTPMPVVITNFSLQEKEASVGVKWESSLESEIREYEVQRSTDGVEFNTIGVVPAEGYEETTGYNFEDGNPSSGAIYYRLAIISHTDDMAYSNVTHIDYSGATSDLVVFPSVISGTDINFKGGDINNKKVQVRVYDLSGKSVLAESISTNSEEVQTINFPKKLNRGNYYIQFVYDNLVKKEKFMVAE
jgi:hypothetical protein